MKGYQIRAKSPGVLPEEFAGATDEWYIPFDQYPFTRNPALEAGVVTSFAERNGIYVSRVFTRLGLDEHKARGGVVSHTVSVPERFLTEGLTLGSVDKAMKEFVRRIEEESSEKCIPIGEIPALRVTWENAGEDEDATPLKSSMRREQGEKIENAFRSNAKPKIIIIIKRNYSDRIKLMYSVAKFLLEYGFRSFRVTSDVPQNTILDFYSNVVITDEMPSGLRPNSGWIPITVSAGRAEGKEIDEEKGRKVMKKFFP